MNNVTATNITARIPETMWKFLSASLMTAPEYRIQTPHATVVNSRIPVREDKMV